MFLGGLRPWDLFQPFLRAILCILPRTKVPGIVLGSSSRFCPKKNSTKKLRKNFIDFSLFQLFSFLRLWDLHHSEKPELVSMNSLKESFGDGLELEIQTSGPRKIAKRAFLVGGILVGIRVCVMSKIWNSSPSGTRAQDHPRNFCSGQNA